jgi:uncharacterized small protein (DUF1192 family)
MFKLEVTLALKVGSESTAVMNFITSSFTTKIPLSHAAAGGGLSAAAARRLRDQYKTEARCSAALRSQVQRLLDLSTLDGSAALMGEVQRLRAQIVQDAQRSAAFVAGVQHRHTQILQARERQFRDWSASAEGRIATLTAEVQRLGAESVQHAAETQTFRVLLGAQRTSAAQRAATLEAQVQQLGAQRTSAEQHAAALEAEVQQLGAQRTSAEQHAAALEAEVQRLRNQISVMTLIHQLELHEPS